MGVSNTRANLGKDYCNNRSIKCYLRLQRAINMLKSSAKYFLKEHIACMGKKITSRDLSETHSGVDLVHHFHIVNW